MSQKGIRVSPDAMTWGLIEVVFHEGSEAARSYRKKIKLSAPPRSRFGLRRDDEVGVWIDVPGAPMKSASGEGLCSGPDRSLISKKN